LEVKETADSSVDIVLHCITSIFMTCTAHQIWIGWSSKE